MGVCQAQRIAGMTKAEAWAEAAKGMVLMKKVVSEKPRQIEAEKTSSHGIVEPAKAEKEVSKARVRSNVSPIPYDAAKTDYFLCGLTSASASACSTPNQLVGPPPAYWLWQPVNATSSPPPGVLELSEATVISKLPDAKLDRTMVDNTDTDIHGVPIVASGKLSGKSVGDMQRTAEKDAAAVTDKKILP